MSVALAWFTQVFAERRLDEPSNRRQYEDELMRSHAQIHLVLPAATPPPPDNSIESLSLPRLLPATALRKEVEASLRLRKYALLGRMPLSSFFAIRGCVLTEIPKRDSPESYTRFFRLLPETSEILIDGHAPQPLLGATASLSPWATRELRESAKGASLRGFRLILQSSELNVLANSLAEREHWLLAVHALPIGPVYSGRIKATGRGARATSPPVV